MVALISYGAAVLAERTDGDGVAVVAERHAVAEGIPRGRVGALDVPAVTGARAVVHEHTAPALGE